MKKWLIICISLFVSTILTARDFNTVQLNASSTSFILDRTHRPKAQIPKLSSTLNQLIRDYQNNLDFRTNALQRGLSLEQDKVIVFGIGQDEKRGEHDPFISDSGRA